jgi:hypothetical protein
MKNILLTIGVVLFGISVFGQQLTKQDYLAKSKNQKTWAIILTAGGGLAVVGGIISYGAESTTSYYPGHEVGIALMIGGAAAITGGIVLFSASKRNEKKANEMAMAFRFKLESTDMYKYNHAVRNSYPAMAVNIGLGNLVHR